MATTRAFSIEDGNLNTGGSLVSTRDKSYKDIDLAFIARPDGDIFKKTDAAAVKQSVKSLLMTGLGERPFRPDLGADLGTILFENASDATEIELDLIIRTAIENYEPRARVKEVDINNNLDRNQIFVRVAFEILNTQETVTLETSLSRLR